MHGVALDMDGVIFNTVERKALAFLAVFKDRSPRERSRIDSYNRANPGVPRVRKMEHVASEILHVDEPAITGWLERYSTLLASIAEPPPLIAGARELFCDEEIDVFVCSSAPELEVRSQLALHGLDNLAKAVFGFPTSKEEALKQLKKAYGANLCFVGDAPADEQAALAADVRFILRSVHRKSHGKRITVISDLQNHRRWALHSS